MEKITISDVAREAGVAISTASKALNGRGAIGADTIKRVESAAKRLGYKPNRAAQLLAGKNKNIGIVMPLNPPEVLLPLRDGLTETLDEYAAFGFRYTLSSYRLGDRADFIEKFNSLRRDVNGMIFIPTYGFDSCRAEITSPGLCKVALQLAVDPGFCPSVTVEEKMVGRMAAEFLAFTGVKRAAIIVGNRTASIHSMNIEGFSVEAAHRGVAVSGIHDSFDDMRTAYEVTSKIVESGCPDGIFVSSYVSPAVCACLSDKGLAGRVRVIGVDIFDRSAECLKNGSLSAVIYQNQREQSRVSVLQLLALMRDERVGSVHIKPELVMQSNLPYYFN